LDEQPRDRDDAPAAEPGSAAGRPRSVEAEETRQRDRRLVDRARGGDLDAFNLLVLHYQDYLVALTTRVR